MRVNRFIHTGAAALLAAGAFAAAPSAGADTASLGGPGRLDDGSSVQEWTIAGLRPSSDTVPYTPEGTLWEATATNSAIEGAVVPMVSNLNARTADGQNYRVLFMLATPQGVNPSTLESGESTTGKVYFDVTGASPDRVVYNDGSQDLITWTAPAPATADTPTAPTPRASTPTAPAAQQPTQAQADAADDAQSADAAETGADEQTASEGTQALDNESDNANSLGTPLDENADQVADTNPGSTEETSDEEPRSVGTPVITGEEQPANTGTVQPASTPSAEGAAEDLSVGTPHGPQG